IASYFGRLRYASRNVGRWRYERMSRYCAGFTMPGCGRQSRDVGAQGKIESNGAVGNWVLSTIDEVGVAAHFTSNSQMLSASEVAPYGPPSSCVPTIGAGSAGCVNPS